MFEALEEEARRRAERRAACRLARIEAALAAELPRDIEIETVDGAVVLAGRGLRRRLALDPELRSLIGRVA